METKTIKLSDKQKEVIRLMREGWELAKSRTFKGRSWLQKNAIGKGGETKYLHRSTFITLYERKLIEGEYSFPTSKFTLTEIGKTIPI